MSSVRAILIDKNKDHTEIREVTIQKLAEMKCIQ